MSISPTLAVMQRNGFPIGGESSVALDLVDTVANAHTTPTDLLADNAELWWELESGRLPESAAPLPAVTARLRAALRVVIEARIDNVAPDGKAVAELNRVADSARSNPRLVVDGGTPRTTTTWHAERGANARLAAVAHDGIQLVSDPVRAGMLRRCANPTCSMLFLAENPRRVWCASNICGNRARVARHLERQREAQ
jgi:predicted RNA-binding Zn ribbon-like protein